MKSIPQVCHQTNLSDQTIFDRIKMLGIKPTKIKKRFFLNDDQIEEIKNFSPYYKDIRKFKKYSKMKIKIIDCFLQNKENSSSQIAKDLNLDIHFVNSTINEWLENDKTIIVASKL
jgi:hypothetical protein